MKSVGKAFGRFPASDIRCAEKDQRRNETEEVLDPNRLHCLRGSHDEIHADDNRCHIGKRDPLQPPCTRQRMLLFGRKFFSGGCFHRDVSSGGTACASIAKLLARPLWLCRNRSTSSSHRLSPGMTAHTCL